MARHPFPAPAGPVAITGVSRGMGLALARELAARGLHVAGCATSTASLRGAAAELGERATLDAVDVTDAGAVDAWAAAVVAEHGAPELVIASAGVINAPAPIWQLDPADVAAALAVNVGGVAHAARAFLPAMIARGRGTFVAISSGWGRRAKGGLAPYCASKFAVEGLVQAVAQELPAAVRIVSLDPGNGVWTAMLETCLPDEHDRYPSPERWAAVATGFILDVACAAPSGSALTVPLVEAPPRAEVAS